MRTFFSSDYHFQHTNIIKYCNRPFKTTEEMDETIIKKHNERVEKYDIVYFVGDFGFNVNISKYLKRLNGRFILIKGNHDSKNRNNLQTENQFIVILKGGIRTKIIHDPTYAQIEYALNICGHVHDAWKVKEVNYCGKKSLIVNVAVEQWNYYPVEWMEIQRLYDKWKAQDYSIKGLT